MRSLITVTLTALSLCACADNAATLTPQSNDRVKTEQITDGLDHPWSLAFLPGNEWLITERRGTLRRLVNGSLQEDPVSGVPEVVASGQGGLFDVMPHPDFADNQRLYLSYAKPCGDDGGTTAVGYGCLLYTSPSPRD